jgi:RPA family protein
VSGRETAWRLLAHELGSARSEERGEGERAATYLFTGLGARVNRILLAGHLDPAEPAGRDGGPSFYRARFTDPTGSFTVTAGSFQPRALTALRALPSGGEVILVGKPTLFQGRDGTPSVSVRAEDLRPASGEEVRVLQAEAARQTARRIELLRRLRRGSAPTEESLRSEGFPGLWITSARAALRRDPALDPERFLEPLARLRGSAGPPGPAMPAPPVSAAPAPPRPTGRPVAAAASPVPSAPRPADHAQESIFLDIVDELAEGADDGFADLKQAERRASQRGIPPERVEEILGRLESDGVIEEPVVGKLRRA